MKALTNLHDMLATLAVRDRGDYVYQSVSALPDDQDILAAVWEDEGLSIVVAAPPGTSERVFACLTLEVFSSLEAVGLTAAVSQALAAAEIACNVIAGVHHDHLLVPRTRAADAVAVLHNLREAARSDE